MAFVETASTEAGLVAAFLVQAGELAKLAMEARDNLKLLATLERHFQVSGIYEICAGSGLGSRSKLQDQWKGLAVVCVT